MFLLVYLLLLFAVGLPYMIVEISVGRASRRSLAGVFEKLGEKNNGFRRHKYWMMLGNYLLMSFYGLVTGWLLYYAVQTAIGGFGESLTEAQANVIFENLMADPVTMGIYMIICSAIAFVVVSMGVSKGVERITKPMMIVLFAMLILMVVNAFFMDGFVEGISYYLVPDFSRIEKAGIVSIVWAAMSQAFFTLSLGSGVIQIFGTYASKDHTVVSDSLMIAGLDTMVAVLAGFVVFPICFTFGVEPSSGPGLLFISLNTVFSNMAGGRILGMVFFVFMLFAAMTTLIGDYESVIAIASELFGISRKRSVIYNFLVITAMAVPVVLGYNLLDFIHPLGGESTILDLQDFLVSNNFLPLGAVVFMLFVTWRGGMKWKDFIAEVNTGKGIKLPAGLLWYFRYVLPLIVLCVFVAGYIQFFNS